MNEQKPMTSEPINQISTPKAIYKNREEFLRTFLDEPTITGAAIIAIAREYVNLEDNFKNWRFHEERRDEENKKLFEQNKVDREYRNEQIYKLNALIDVKQKEIADRDATIKALIKTVKRQATMIKNLKAKKQLKR